jgi:hypothetical protein
VDDAESLAQRCRDRRSTHRLVELSPPQIADRWHDAQGDVQCMSRFDHRSLLVMRTGASSLWLAARSLALAAAPEEVLLHVPFAPGIRLHELVDSH